MMYEENVELTVETKPPTASGILGTSATGKDGQDDLVDCEPAVSCSKMLHSGTLESFLFLPHAAERKSHRTL